ncbi:MAG: hypothetical protein KUG56_08350 [Kordiimonadaceae bacterium]|nr:hypothetical protein [Kordiimonadaceae bacterium]
MCDRDLLLINGHLMLPIELFGPLSVEQELGLFEETSDWLAQYGFTDVLISIVTDKDFGSGIGISNLFNEISINQVRAFVSFMTAAISEESVDVLPLTQCIIKISDRLTLNPLKGISIPGEKMVETISGLADLLYLVGYDVPAHDIEKSIFEIFENTCNRPPSGFEKSEIRDFVIEAKMKWSDNSFLSDQ